MILDAENAEASAKAMIEALLPPIQGLMGHMPDPKDQLTFFFFLFGGLMGICTASTTPLATQVILSDLLKQHIAADQGGNFSGEGQAPSAPH
jgi:hypothetical protein